MSYLDNLENNLKALENQEQRDPANIKREQQRRESERNAAVLRAPHAEALKTSPFTSELMTQCRTLGRAQRVLVQFAWIGDALRFDAKEKRMELSPTEDGIVAIFSVGGEETNRAAINPQSDDAAALAQRWLAAD